MGPPEVETHLDVLPELEQRSRQLLDSLVSGVMYGRYVAKGLLLRLSPGGLVHLLVD